jgi:hypothetical protein
MDSDSRNRISHNPGITDIGSDRFISGSEYIPLDNHEWFMSEFY